jgi:hypothetical protein
VYGLGGRSVDAAPQVQHPAQSRSSGAMPPRRATAGEAAARRAAEELVAAAAAEPPPMGAAAAGRGSAAASADASARAGPPRRRVSAALAALRDTLEGVSPAGAAREAVGVDGLFAALLREAAAPPGAHATYAAECLLAIGMAAARPGQRAAAAALSSALRRDAACLFDAMGRVAALQAAARAAASSPLPAAGAGLNAAAAGTPGLQLFVLVSLAGHLLADELGPDDGSRAKAFARSGGAVAAALEVLLHGCPGCVDGAHARHEAARALSLVCRDPTGARHLRGAFPRVVPALLQRLERGAPGSTYLERSCVVESLLVRWGCARRAGGQRAWDAGLRAADRVCCFVSRACVGVAELCCTHDRSIPTP